MEIVKAINNQDVMWIIKLMMAGDDTINLQNVVAIKVNVGEYMQWVQTVLVNGHIINISKCTDINF